MIEIPLSLTEAGMALRAGTLSSVELTAASLDRADVLDGQLGVYLTRFDAQALDAAHRADADFAAGHDRGPLQGIPFGVKDILAAVEGPTTAQSLVLDPAWGAERDAPVVARIRRGGAVITGKLSTMEFACGVPDPEKSFPIPRNPWNPDTWPGGSSSGTGAGVAAGMFLAGFGTDTGGSIRIPSAFCGVSGLMPTFGRVPKSGCVPLGYSLDHVGPLARSARDCAAVLGVIAGYHPSDAGSIDHPVDDYLGALSGSLEGIRLGVDRAHHFPPDADPGLAGLLDDAIAAFCDLGATVTDISLPHYAEGVVANTVTMAAEALAYHRQDLQARWHDYTPGVRAIAASGALVSGADFVQAQRVRRVILGEIAALFASFDALIMPTAAMEAPSYDEIFDPDRGIETLLGRVFAQYWDCLNSPVLAVPVGFGAAGLPLSMQIAGRPFEEATVLLVGDAYQQITDWHRQLPPLALALAAASPVGSVSAEEV
jgi:aspartyl-tRNA(Asn)/glutamyl-tRNA(Gln) amidotransferase subunit A